VTLPGTTPSSNVHAPIIWSRKLSLDQAANLT
jgi:hypothetical protein